MTLEQTWRWFGPHDPISLQDICQTGATGIVSALHQLSNGVEWPVYEIKARQALIEAAGLTWSVVESIPVHDDIKRRSGKYQEYIQNYAQSLRNVGACGIPVVCYNFMPVLDWTRTDLAYAVADNSLALRFDRTEIAAFDVFILKRPAAAASYPPQVLESAERWLATADDAAIAKLVRNIIAGLPGSEESYTVEQFREVLAAYDGISADVLRANLLAFLAEIAPVAEEAGVKLAIHPDDPPFPMFGLPRVVSTVADCQAIFNAYDSPYNGLCFCTGSFGARADNHLPTMLDQLSHRINFLHLRSVQLEADGSFYEANHLEGSAGMADVMYAVVRARGDARVPMRPDHGHLMVYDAHKKGGNPGYSLYGRMRGLAELRGLEMGIRRSLG
jgi:mannonate dehydratase